MASAGPGSASQSTPQSAIAVLDEIEGVLDHSTVCLLDIVQRMGRTSFTPLLLIPALTVLSPLSGVPGLSSLCGIIIALISLQMLLGRDHLWLPDWLMRRQLSAAKAHNALAWFRRPAAWLDRITRPRLHFLVSPPGNLLPKAVCFVSGAIMPLLELLPFTSSVLGSIVALTAIGFQVRDGAFTLAGLAIFTVLGSAMAMVFL